MTEPPITGMARHALIRALAAVLVADMRRPPEREAPTSSAAEAGSGVSPSGTARSTRKSAGLLAAPHRPDREDRMSAERGGPGGKWLGRSGAMTPTEIREALADVRDQVEREPAVLDHLGEAILSRDLTTTSEILAHLRDLFVVLAALLRLVRVADAEPEPGP